MVGCMMACMIEGSAVGCDSVARSVSVVVMDVIFGREGVTCAKASIGNARMTPIEHLMLTIGLMIYV